MVESRLLLFALIFTSRQVKDLIVLELIIQEHYS